MDRGSLFCAGPGGGGSFGEWEARESWGCGAGSSGLAGVGVGMLDGGVEMDIATESNNES